MSTLIDNVGYCQALKSNNYESEPLLRASGISISTNFTQVDGRVLPTPKVHFQEILFLMDVYTNQFYCNLDLFGVGEKVSTNL